MYLFIYSFTYSFQPLRSRLPRSTTYERHSALLLGSRERKPRLRFQCTLVLSNRQEGEQGGKKT